MDARAFRVRGYAVDGEGATVARVRFGTTCGKVVDADISGPHITSGASQGDSTENER